jgi:hypothetical protein
MEAFEEPDRSWDALVLRHLSGKSRFVVVYDIGGKSPWINAAEWLAIDDEVGVNLQTPKGSVSVRVNSGKCLLSAT